MSRRSIRLDDSLEAYIRKVSLREPEVLRRLRAETAEMEHAGMQIAPEQGQFMGMLAQLIDARRYLEIGVFTGYSTLAVALAMPPEGRVVACDKSDAWTSVAQRYWQEAGVADRIELRLGDARKTLDNLIAGGASGSFDFAFIDADKENYDAYYERVLTLLRPGGLVAIDNVLWSGKVADPSARDYESAALRALNHKLYGDRRVTICLLPLGDGLTLARKTP
ncbi:MAG TPA: class I SAM-dependent methyltransferase [Alphaproteobacteria bacterium]|jgi:caffeoyl-CoA O-methyltransferase|nr:class I SAM-dependent methyltransferase [Alphaproteobacteria bacterium]